MNKAILLVVFMLSVSVFAEIKFQPPIYTNGRYQNFKYIYQLNQDTMLTNCGPFNMNGDMLALPWVNSVAKDNLGNLWCAVCNSTWLTVIDRNWNQTKYLFADGKGFGNIYSVAFSDGMIVVGSDSGLSVTTPVNGVPGIWTNFSTKAIKEVVAKHGQIWAISYSDYTVGNYNLYRDSSGILLSYASVLPVAGEYWFSPDHCDIDTAGNFWLSYHRFINPPINTEEAGLMKFDGKNWTKYFATTFNYVMSPIDTVEFGIIRVDKWNNLWFVNDRVFDYNFSIGKINLSTMSLEKISFYSLAGTGVGSPLTWQPLTVTVTPAGEALFGGMGCFVRVDYGSAVIWHPVVAKAPNILQKNLSGYIFDPLGRRIAFVNSFSKNLPARNYFFRQANINAKAEKFSVIK